MHPSTELYSVVDLPLSEEEREAVYRLRYDVYISEQGKPYPEADHERKILSDELDNTGEIIAVKSRDAIVGTVRANWIDTLARESLTRVFGISPNITVPLQNICIATRFAIHPCVRGGIISSMLFSAIYKLALYKNTAICFMTCAPRLTKLFEKYGFRQYSTPYNDPVVGQLIRLVLFLGDVDHFKKVRSPFIKIATEKAVRTSNGLNFDDLFTLINTDSHVTFA